MRDSTEIPELEIYQSNNYRSSDIPDGTTWRVAAMREWIPHHRAGLIPLVSDNIDVLNNESCISCGGDIHKKDDPRMDFEIVYKHNSCRYCLSARKMIFEEEWQSYKK